MKKLLLFIFCFISYTSYSQERNNPTFYLNNEKIDVENIFISPMSIDSLFVGKKTKAGEIYLITNKQIKYFNLDSVLYKHTNLTSEQNEILFIIDGKVIKDKSKVLIDKTFFLNVKTEFLDEVNYLEENFKDLIIVDISLKAKQEITIRGDIKTIDGVLNR